MSDLFITNFKKGTARDEELYNNLKAENITSKLWRPKEIVSRIAGATTRQITDLAELEIIPTAHDTTGAGTARLYDGRGLYSIMIALSLRGSLKPDSLKKVVEKILEFEKTKSFKPELVVISPFGGNGNEKDSGAQLTFFFQKNDSELFDVLNFSTGGADPKCYLNTVIHLHDIKKFLKRSFS